MNEDWSCLGEDSKDPYSQICTEAVEDEDVFEKFKKDVEDNLNVFNNSAKIIYENFKKII